MVRDNTKRTKPSEVDDTLRSEICRILHILRKLNATIAFIDKKQRERKEINKYILINI